MNTLPTLQASDISISAISLVDIPAINENFLIHNISNQSFSISGPALIPNLQMYRKVSSAQQGSDCFVYFPEDALVDAAFEFTFGPVPEVLNEDASIEDSSEVQASDPEHRFTLNHNPQLSAQYQSLLSQVQLTNSWISCPDFRPEIDLGFPILPENTWYITIQCPIQLLQVINEHGLRGFSLELSCYLNDSPLAVVI